MDECKQASQDVLKEIDFQIPPKKYEHLDHTADIQLHSWGETMEEAFEQCALAMYSYMTELEYVEIKEVYYVEAQGTDMENLLFHFLDELLFLFSAEPNLIARTVKIEEFDRENFKIKARAAGETFRIGKHPQGAEVKAITYSCMKIRDRPEAEKPELFVILDI